MKRYLLLIFCFTLLGAGSAYGQPYKIHTFELRPEVFYYSYKEPDLDVKIDGIMYGAAASYTYRLGLMLKAEGRGSFGYVDYQNSGTIKNTRDYAFELRGLGGWDFVLSKNFTMTPYIGFGYRYLNDDNSNEVSSTGALGYERESNYYYSPAGIEFNTGFDNRWSVGQIIEYDYLWYGKQKSHLSDADPLFNDISNRQESGWGLRASFTLRRQGDRVDFEIGPFLRYWQIKSSEREVLTFGGIPVDVAWEPKNRTHEIGLMAAFKF